MMYTKRIEYDSPEPIKIIDITADANDFLGKVTQMSRKPSGLFIAQSLHTTFGFFNGELAEIGLIEDMLNFARNLVPEDRRSTWVEGKEDQYPYPVADYLHECMLNTRRPAGEMDLDHNAARHLRGLVFSSPVTLVPYAEGKLVLGKYQHLAAWEQDGRDGTGINPRRKRVVNLYALPQDIVEIK